jgi:phage protein D
MSGSGLAVPVPNWAILYNGVDITAATTDSVVEISYEESIGKRACSVELVLSDNELAMQANPPAIGATIDLSLGYQGGQLTHVGTFQIDEYGLKGPPDRFSIKAIQAGLMQPTRTQNSVAYEGQNLLQIANTVAAKHGYTVVGDAVNPNVAYDRVTQALETDLAFLHRIANMHNYDFNVRGNLLVFYSRPALEAMAPVGVITRAGVIEFDFKNQTLGSPTYGKCVVSYLDPSTKQLVTGSATDSNVPTSDTLKATERVENGQQASLRAQSYLHEHNMGRVGAKLVVPGTVAYRAGNNLNVSGFGAFDGETYQVKKAKHGLSKDGWKVSLDLKVNVAGAGAQTVGPDITTPAASPVTTEPGT